MHRANLPNRDTANTRRRCGQRRHTALYTRANYFTNQVSNQVTNQVSNPDTNQDTNFLPIRSTLSLRLLQFVWREVLRSWRQPPLDR